MRQGGDVTSPPPNATLANANCSPLLLVFFHSNNQVSLSYLRSYTGMGTADLACVSGCKCAPQVRLLIGSRFPASTCSCWVEGGRVGSGCRRWTAVLGRLGASRCVPAATRPLARVQKHAPALPAPAAQVIDGTWQQEVSLQQILQIWVSEWWCRL